MGVFKNYLVLGILSFERLLAVMADLVSLKLCCFGCRL